MKNAPSRRKFLQHMLAGSSTIGLTLALPSRGKVSPNAKMNLGIVGVTGRGGENLSGVSGENIIGLCDVDETRLQAVAAKFPGAKTFADFRRLLDLKDLDAVVISTPDHTHAVAAAAALRRGLHVYCEKPLTHTVSEARIVTELARKNRRVTQMGTQIHAGKNYRRVVELIKSGAIGRVLEVHVWASASYGDIKVKAEQPPVPSQLDYDLWLGPVASRPYRAEYHPFHWRHFWAFGGGALADFGCHFMDLPFWALDLKYPERVEALDGPPLHAELTPPWLIVRYDFPRLGDRGPINLTWYHGGKQPERLSKELKEKWKSGVLFVGEKGELLADYGRRQLLPEEQYKDFSAPEPTIPDSIGHHMEWIDACKNGGRTTCNFDYAGPLTETALLGNVAYRVGKPLQWDPKKLAAKDCREAEEFVQHHYRKGWKL